MPTHFVWVTGIQVCFFTFFQLIFNEPPLFFLKKKEEITSSSKKQAKAKNHSPSLWHP